MQDFFCSVMRLLINSVKGFLEDRCILAAAALSYTTLFALVPLTVLIILIFSAFPSFQPVIAHLQDFATKNLVAHSASLITDSFRTFIHHSRHLSVVGICFLVVVSVLMVFNMEKTFNRIWRVPLPRRGLSGFLMYWGVLTLIPMLMGLLVFTSNTLESMVWFRDVMVLLGLKALLVALTPFVVIVVSLMLLYLTLPNCRVPWVSALTASVVVTFCFALLRWGYGIYMAHATVEMNLYGALSVIPFFLTWIFCNWLLILFGVEISYHVTLIRQETSHGDQGIECE